MDPSWLSGLQGAGWGRGQAQRCAEEQAQCVWGEWVPGECCRAGLPWELSRELAQPGVTLPLLPRGVCCSGCLMGGAPLEWTEPGCSLPPREGLSHLTNTCCSSTGPPTPHFSSLPNSQPYPTPPSFSSNSSPSRTPYLFFSCTKSDPKYALDFLGNLSFLACC